MLLQIVRGKLWGKQSCPEGSKRPEMPVPCTFPTPPTAPRTALRSRWCAVRGCRRPGAASAPPIRLAFFHRHDGMANSIWRHCHRDLPTKSRRTGEVVGTNRGLNVGRAHLIPNERPTSITVESTHPHSPEEARMRVAVAAWGRHRWPGYRCIHEVPLSERRIDMVFVGVKDIAGVEIKSSRDRLDRLEVPIEEYRRWLPEIWVAVAIKWQHHDALGFSRRNLIWVDDGAEDAADVIEDRLGRRAGSSAAASRCGITCS